VRFIVAPAAADVHTAGEFAEGAILVKESDPFPTERRAQPFPLAVLALVIGLLSWFFAYDPLPGRIPDGQWYETVLLVTTACGVVGAIGVGFSLYSLRLRWTILAAWLSLIVNGGLVALALVRIVRWL
jgi:hypothetical protein